MNIQRVVMGGLFLSLTACGGGGSSNDSDDHVTKKTGVFLDSQVINIGYKTETLSGITNQLGEYEYLSGERVTFFIGDLEFPSVKATEVITPLNIVGTQDTSAPTVVNIIRLLQTLDQDGNAENGITIADIASSIATQVNFDLNVSDFESSTAVSTLILNAGQDQTVSELVTEVEAISHFETSLSGTPLSSGDAIEIPVKSILIDGNNNDWVGVQPIGLDQTGEQNGNSSTDLVKVAIAKSGETIALLIETSGDIKLPHTPNSDYSHYEIGFHFHNDSSCDGEDNGYFIVNNFTDSSGQNYHRIEGWFDDSTLTDTENQPTTIAYTGNILETSFNLSMLPRNKGSYISLYPYIQSFNQGVSTHHDDVDTDVCFRLPAQQI